MLKIAALLDEAGNAADMQEEGIIYIFERKNEEWSSDIKFDYHPAKFDSMDELREHIGFVSRQLSDCKIMAAKTSIGFYRLTFEGFGVMFWAVEGAVQDFISMIDTFYAKQEALPKPAEKPQEFITRVFGKSGYYTADLREVMAHRTSLNSKEILMPFFKRTSFSQLEITCDHMPKWFEKELPALKLRADAKLVDKTLKIYVYPKLNRLS